MSAQVFQPLNDFFPHIFVVSLQRAADRKAKLEPLLQGLRFEYFEAFDKRWLDTDERIAAVYDDAKARQLHRYSKPMGTGPIACSISHLRIYERMMAEHISHALILEDDAVPQVAALAQWPAMLQELPPDWDLLYLGYDKNDAPTATTPLKRWLYHLQHRLGLLKWNHTMINNLVARPYSQHLWRAGYHDFTHAYAISLRGARLMAEIHRPVCLEADTALSHAATNQLLQAFICKPMLFLQEFQVSPDTYTSMVKED